MRLALAEELRGHAGRPELVFLTGDLGFQTLEPLAAALKGRFLNAGIAEQNMVGVAAGMAREGLFPWIYSIAPFAYARPFEQLRNDVFLHRLPVVIVGNGGGYGYGVMGATHHAIDDYGAVLCLPGAEALVPAFLDDIAPLVTDLFERRRPAYLRLGRCERPRDLRAPAYAPWRKLCAGDAATLVVTGPIAGSLWARAASLDESRRPSIWVVTELPLSARSVPVELLEEIRRSPTLVVVEEHVAHGGLGAMLARVLVETGTMPRRFAHRHAMGYPSGTYGSQAFHRGESGLDAEAIFSSWAG